MTVRRRVVEKTYERQIQAMYADRRDLINSLTPAIPN
jgi:hypothetical protein